MRRWIFALAALLLAMPGYAADKQGNFAFGYDVASTTLTYCTVDGRNGDPFDTTGFKFQAPDFDISIAAGAVTDTGANGSFAAVVVGDTFILRPGDGDTSNTPVVPSVETWVTAKADSDNITVADIAATATYRAYYYKNLVCGTNSEAGWIKVDDLVSLTLSIFYTDGDLGALEVVWECREAAVGSLALQVYPGPASDCGFGTLSTNVCSFTALDSALGREIQGGNFSQCRIGLRHDGTDGGIREAVHATISGTVRNP